MRLQVGMLSAAALAGGGERAVARAGRFAGFVDACGGCGRSVRWLGRVRPEDPVW
jgi:hypothetical protein